MKKIVVIGGGVTGLSVAWKLSEKGYKVDVVESNTSIGGLAKSIKIENYLFDIGPHSFFSEDEEIFKKVMDLFKGELDECPNTLIGALKYYSMVNTLIILYQQKVSCSKWDFFQQFYVL